MTDRSEDPPLWTPAMQAAIAGMGARALGLEAKYLPCDLLHEGQAAVGTVHRHDFLTLVAGDGSRHGLVLRRCRQPGFPAALPLATQAALMARLAAAGLPLPDLLGHLAIGELDGLLMRHLPGLSAGREVVALGQNNSLARRLGSLLAQVHALAPDPAAPAAPLPSWSDQAEAFLRRLPDDHPLSADARAAFLVDCAAVAAALRGAPVLLHGDYRTGNYLVDPHPGAGSVTLLDFDLMHWGDPRMDLAWFLSPSWRYGQPARIAGGVGSLGAFIAGYGEAAIEATEPLWQRFALSRWAVMALVQYDRGRTAGVAAWMAEASEAGLALARRAALR